MVLILLILSLLLGPLLYLSGKKKSSQPLKVIGAILWVLGWGYLLYVLGALLYWKETGNFPVKVQ
jgi:hypothetical protein